MKLAAVFLLTTLPVFAAPAHKSTQRIVDELRFDRNLINTLRPDCEGDVHFTETVEAYHNALADLEDYQSGDPQISRERVENDAQEVWMDLAPYRDSSGVMR